LFFFYTLEVLLYTSCVLGFCPFTLLMILPLYTFNEFELLTRKNAKKKIKNYGKY
jgi:hypothetical protein